MKEFILSCVAVVLASVIVEIFSPLNKMKKSLYFAFSLVVLLVLTSGIKGTIKKAETLDMSNYHTEIEANVGSLFSSTIEQSETLIVEQLKYNDIVVEDLTLDYEVSELKAKITSASVSILNKEDKTKTKKIIQNLTGLEEGDIKIWVK